MRWADPPAQIWHVEMLLLTCLVLRLALRRDGRSRFEGLMLTLWVFDVVGLVCARMQNFVVYTNLAYVSYLVSLPLIALALSEASDYRPVYHRRILFWWTAFTIACLGIRFFPYTGRVMLIGNSVAYSLWLWESFRRSRV